MPQAWDSQRIHPCYRTVFQILINQVSSVKLFLWKPPTVTKLLKNVMLQQMKINLADEFSKTFLERYNFKDYNHSLQIHGSWTQKKRIQVLHVLIFPSCHMLLSRFILYAPSWLQAPWADGSLPPNQIHISNTSRVRSFVELYSPLISLPFLSVQTSVQTCTTKKFIIFRYKTLILQLSKQGTSSSLPL